MLLKTGANSEASKAFLAFLKGPEARAIMAKFGYGSPELELSVHAIARLRFWAPISLTIELAAITTTCPADRRDADRLVARAFQGLVWKEAVAAVVSLPMVLPPTVLGFYLLDLRLGPTGPGA